MINTGNFQLFSEGSYHLHDLDNYYLRSVYNVDFLICLTNMVKITVKLKRLQNQSQKPISVAHPKVTAPVLIHVNYKNDQVTVFLKRKNAAQDAMNKIPGWKIFLKLSTHSVIGTKFYILEKYQYLPRAYKTILRAIGSSPVP